ncbi:MAG TPA: hypothetical protein VE863_06970 [Pyrinomonadaceae bacterium]|jgi:hypothetical protein|nr:hypothetical protein [Pyrinomonadaceae bacterium]
MKKGFAILITIGVCALGQLAASAQSVNLLPDANGDTVPAASASASTPAEGTQPLPISDLRGKLTEATALLKSHAPADEKTVSLAVLDRDTSAIEVLSMAKDTFLTKGASLSVTSQSGRTLYLTVVRANGVNTAVRVSDARTGKELTPLTVAFPIVKGGSITEVAYYSSAHPAILSTDVTDDGEAYISTMLDHAKDELDAKGVHVPLDIVDVAEHLCVVEHTDHKRFMNEDHTALLPEIVSLYALNQGDTFRYSVSTAGAGGMIQMIPRTYEAIRQDHPAVPLQTDFVSGMRDHANALEAMLLYMNDTWTKLSESSDVQDAMRNGIATKPELLAAGYNSNPIKLPIYLKNGGANWRTLIPAETQMYLSIYSEVDRNVKFPRRNDRVETVNPSQNQPTLREPRLEALLAWVDNLFARVL